MRAEDPALASAAAADIRGCAASLGFCIIMTFIPQAKLPDFDGMGARSEPEMVKPQHRHRVFKYLRTSTKLLSKVQLQLTSSS